MRKPVAIPIPTLAFAALQEIQNVQSAALNGLLNCGLPGTKFLNHDRAAEVMSSCAAEDVEIRLRYYMALPEFHKGWAVEIIERSIDSILGCFPNFKFEMRFEDSRQLVVPGGFTKFEDGRQFYGDVKGSVVAYVRKKFGLGGLITKEDVSAEGRFEDAEPASVPSRPQTATSAPASPSERASLRDSYRTVFPDAGIMDICWAAKQHYREWTRWLKGELRDGSKPDRAFRHVLVSGRPTSALRRETRPKGWK